MALYIQETKKKVLLELKPPSGFFWTPLWQQKERRKKECKEEGQERRL